MQEEEIASRHSEIVERIRMSFMYLVDTYGFRPSENESNEEKQRVLLIYENKDDGGIVEILDEYHPYDHGFEINLYNSIEHRALCESDDNDGEMVYHMDKVDQDKQLSFIDEGAKELQRHLRAKGKAG